VLGNENTEVIGYKHNLGKILHILIPGGKMGFVLALTIGGLVALAITTIVATLVGRVVSDIYEKLTGRNE